MRRILQEVDVTTSASVRIPGNVAEMAARIQQEVGGELFSIRVEEPYPADYDACLDRAADEKAENARPKLVEKVSDLSEYDVMFLGYRIDGAAHQWLFFPSWRRMTLAVRRLCCSAPTGQEGLRPA